MVMSVIFCSTYEVGLSFDHFNLLAVVFLGLISGTIGGMLGVGGSTMIIPGLTVIFGYNQHVYQAAAMVANVAVSVPAALRHHRTGATMVSVLQIMLPLAVVCVLMGVWLSNRPMFRGVSGGLWLGRLLALFLLYVVATNVLRIDGRRPYNAAAGRGFDVRDDSLCQQAGAGSVRQPGRSAALGAVMGLIAGLLGIGGGAVAVPLQQLVLKLPLRTCIANSSAVICISATVGAVYKNISLAQHGQHWHQSMSLALLLAPSCWLGGHLGAGLTHRLPVRRVRQAFVCLMVVAAIKMAAIF